MAAPSKDWERPWSMDEMIENSDKWTLAGDVALYHTLQNFAQNMFNRVTEIDNGLDNLTKNLEEDRLKLKIAQNEFQSLRNRQFIESRVYDEDETLSPPGNAEKKEEKKDINETEQIRLAALKGLSAIEKYFDRVEVSLSESDDDDANALPSYILRPKDPYINRPLPYVIGSEEWHKSWHVGLIDSSSDSDSDKLSDEISESDSDDYTNPQKIPPSQIKGASDTSSEIDFSNRPVLVESKPDLFGSSDSENSVPQVAPVSNKSFAEQLASKLGNVIEQEPEVNTRPLQKHTATNYGDNLFFDEPPPLDEPGSKGLFSGGGGLFDDDDNDDDEFLTPSESKSLEVEKPSQKRSGGLFDEASSDEDIFIGKKTILPAPNVVDKPPLFDEEPPALDEKKKPVGGVSIFGGRDVFNKKLLKRQPSSSEEEEKEEQSDTKQETTVPKTKIDLFNEDEEDDLFSTKIADTITNIKKEEKPKTEESKVSLFDDVDDLFKDDLFSTPSTKKFTSGLFDDYDDTRTGDDLFSRSTTNATATKPDLFEDLPDNKNSINANTKSETNEQPPTPKLLEEKTIDQKPAVGLFEGQTNDDLFGGPETKEQPDRSLFEDKISGNLFGGAETQKQSDRSLFENKTSDDLFGGPETKEQPDRSLFEDKTNDYLFGGAETKEQPDESLFEDKTNDNLFSSLESKKTVESKFSLFDSPPPEPEDDLFADTADIIKTIESKSLPMDTSPDDDLFKATNQKPPTLPISLFDPTPPPIDQWETKSDTMSIDFDSNDPDQEESSNQKSSSLFDDEPPIFENKVTNMTQKFEKTPEEVATAKPKASPGKLKHNLNINVGALMPGFVPPKRRETEENKESEDNIPRVKKMVSFEEVDVDNNPKEVSFDSTDNVQVLQSVTKDRARVPFQRRPSTRRGRKATLQNSEKDFKLEQEEEEKSSEISSIGNTGSSTDDILDSSASFVESKELKNTVEDVFRVTSKKETKMSSNKNDLFADSDEDGDLFSGKKAVQATKVLKKSLFDDDDQDNDDEDIFKKSFVSNATVKKTDTKIAAEKKLPKVSVKKLENTKPDDDPLSALLK